MNWEVENLNEMEVTKDGIIYIWDNLVLQMKANIYIYIRWAWRSLAHEPKSCVWLDFFLHNFFPCMIHGGPTC